MPQNKFPSAVITNSPFKQRSLILILLVWVMVNLACEQIYYSSPKSYPKSIRFTGIILNEDSLPIKGIRIVLSTPADLENDTIYTSSQGNYAIVRQLDFAGPNKLQIRDIDQDGNGGTFTGIDTTFYITQLNYDSSAVQFDFILKKP